VLTISLAGQGGSLFANSALVQAFFVVIGTVLSGDLFYASYGLFFLFFGLLACWKRSLGEVALSGRAGVVWQHAEMKELEV